MMKDDMPVIYREGSQTRDLIYIEDVLRALRIAMASDYHGILNVGTREAHSFNLVIEMLRMKLGSAVQPMYSENPIKNYVANTLAEHPKLSKYLDLRPKFPLRMD